jgi:flagellar basal-body rod protein FlgG
LATGLWTSVSGASARAQAVDVIANNLANQDTLAFKKDLPTFKEYLTTVEREHDAVDVPRGPIKDKDFYPLDGRDQSFVVTDGTYTNFRQGNLKVTQAPLDVALDGPGFLEVSTPSGIRYTRQGSLKMAMDGRLVTPEGYPVLAAQPGGLAAALPVSSVQPIGQGRPDTTQGGVAAGPGPDVAARFINLRDRSGPLTINGAGDIYVGDQLVAKLSVTEFQDRNKLKKYGNLLFENRDPANAIAPQGTQVRQGMLETSNVNPIEEMTNLIQANRMFEHDLKAMKTFGEMMGREANDIGKL